MSKHPTGPRRESRNGASRFNTSRLPSGSLPLRRTWPISLCVGLAIGSIAFSGDALAGGPTGGVVVGGSGSIAQSGNQTVINQISQRLALNWDTFNLKSNESVLFNQPSRSAVALNRILDQNPSQIFGKINSNGQVFLINTHGIIFGATAQMNVGGLMASTLDLTPKDFLAGNYNLNAVGGGAGIVNHGLIQASSGGSISLVGGSVLNDGLILANYGTINLDGADHAVLDFDGNGLINIQITGELKQRLDAREAAVTNKGTLQADGGTVVLQASAAKDLFTSLVNNSGVIDASGISTDGGVVRLVGNGGNVENSGSINVSGVHGGTAQLLSDQNVGITGSIDASGTHGGGNIRVGGGWQGGEGLQTAAVTYVGSDAILNADATQSGNGGSVVVWGNNGNNFFGNISARGGVVGGNGGQVETSSHNGLNVQGQADASAPSGNAGTWLLDPWNVSIVASGGTLTSPFTATADSSINASAINGALTGTNVFVFTGSTGTTSNGDITVNAPIAATSGTGNALYLEAAGSIFLNAGISSDGTNALNVNLWANYGGNAAGTSYTSKATCTTCQVVIGNTASASITTTGGAVNIRTGDGTHAGGSLQLGTSGTITGSIDTSGTTDGALNVVTTGITQLGTGANTIVAGATSLNAGTGAITLGNSGNDFTGAVTATGAGVAITDANDLDITGVTDSGNGAVTLTAGGVLTLPASTINAGTGALTLASNGGALTTSGALTGGAVSLTGRDGITLAGGVTASTLNLSSANAAITQSANALSVTGITTVNAGTSGDITLTAANNAFGDTVNLTGGTTQINSANSLTLGTLATGDLTAAASGGALVLGTGSVTGDLSATSTTSITLNGALTGLGDVTFIGSAPTGTGSITAGTAGTGSITGISTATFNLTGTNAGTSGGIGFNGFATADATQITGAVGFDDTGLSSLGMTFAGATNVTGSGAISSVSGSFADDTMKSSASGISYSGFGSVSGSGTAVMGVIGNFDLGTKVSSSSGINYSGFSLGTVAGSGVGATITGAGQTYNLTGSNAGGNGAVSWSAFRSINDAAGTINFGTSGSVTGNVTAKTLNYTTYGTPVTFDLSNGSNATTGIGGTWSGVTTVAGSGNSDTITGSGKTYTLNDTVANQGSGSGVSWSSFENINDATGTVNFGSNGSVAGNVTAKTLDYGSYLQDLTLDVDTGAISAGGVGGTLSGYDTVTANAARTNTVSGTGQTYALDNTVANKGSSHGYSWSGFQNITDATGTVNFGTAGSITGNLTAHALDYSGHGAAVTFDLSDGSNATSGIGGTWTDVAAVTGSSHADTVHGNNQTYNLTTANAGNNGLVSWTSFENLSDGSAGNFVFANGASVSGTLTGGGAGTLDYSAYTTAVNVGLAGTATGTGGWSGIATAKGGSASDTISGSGKTYNLSGSNAGNSGTLSWSSFENLSDSGAGNFVFANGASVSGMLTSVGAGTLDYSAYTTAVNVGLGGTATNIGGWSGITTAKGGSASDTISGSNRTYNLTGANAGNSGTLSWTAFENIADAGTGTIAATGAQTYTLSGSNAGTVTTLLSGGYTGIGSINDATGTINFGTSGSVTGNVTAKTLNYATYGTPVTFDLSNGSNATTGIGGTWSGVTTVAGSGNSDTITGSGKTYTLNDTVANQGSGSGVSWSSFENINDATGTVNFGSNGSVAGNVTAKTLDYGSYLQDLTLDVDTGAISAGGVGGTLSGYDTVTANAARTNTVSGTGQTYALDNTVANKGSSHGYSWSGFQNITDATGTVNFGTAGSITGNLTAHALDYSGHGAAVTFDLSDGSNATSGIGGTWTDVAAVTGSSHADTVHGNNQTYNLTTANAGNNGLVSWTSFENLSDGSAGNFVFANGASVSGTLTGGGAGTLDYSAYTTAVNVGLAGTATGTGGWSGIATAKGGSASDTISGSGKTYNLSGSNAGNSGTLSWSSFENLSDSGAGNFVFANGASVSGMLTSVGAGTLDYSAYTTAVNVGLGGTATNIGGWSGITTAKGGSASDTISGSNRTYNLTGANAGNSGTLSWTAFENIADAGTGTLSAANQTWSLTGHNQGTVTNLAGTFSGIGNLIDTGTGHFIMHSGANGDISGNLNGGTGSSLDYTGYTTAVGVNLSGAGTTGVGGTASGIAAITASSNLGVSGNTSGALQITTTGAGTTTTLGAATIGGNLNITASGAVLQTGGALSVAGTTTIGAGTNAITLTGSSNDFGGTVNLTGGTTQIKDINALILGTVNTGALTVNSGGLTLSGALSSTTASLTSSGTISEGSGGSLVTSILTGQSTGATTLNGINQIGTLGSFSAAGFSLTNARALTVTGAVNGGNSTALTTTAGDLAINSAVSGTTTTLKSASAISEGAGGGITASTLSGQSAGATSLNGINHIGTLGSFSAASFALTDAQALTVAGPLITTGDISLTTTNGILSVNTGLSGNQVSLHSAGNLALSSNVKGATVNLISGGNISQSGGVITAGTLTGQSVGSTDLNGANLIDILGSFTADFSLTNAKTLTVAGPLNGGPVVTLTTTAGDLIINGAVNGMATTLNSAGAISEGAAGVITADTLSGHSAGATSLNGANHIGALGSFSAANFALTNAQTLAVTGPINGGGSTALTTTTGDLAINGAVNGTTTTLKSAGAINEGAGGSLTATTLNGQSTGATTLNGVNHIGALGSFSAANFALTNAQSLAVSGPVNGGASTALTTTAGDLAINGAMSGTTTTLKSAGAISEGGSGSITASNLSGQSAGATSLNGANHIGTLGSFSAANFALTNAQSLAVTGPINGGSSTALTTTVGDLAINGAVTGTTTTLKSAGAISEGAGGSITASSLSGQSAGATSLNGTNHIGTLGSFSAANFALTNAQSLAVSGPVNGGAGTVLTTTTGDLAINGAVNGTATTLNSAGTITEGAGAVITAGTLSGTAAGATMLGSATSHNANMVDTLGDFTSLAGFSMTNDKTLTLASVGGSAFTVNAGTSAFYLSVTNGDLFQLGTAQVYDGLGVWGSTGRMGTASNPIYVIGTGLQSIANVGLPPAYFYALDSSGNLLPLGGGFAINVPTASGAGSAQNGNHGDSYIDPSVITANYRSYGIVPSGVRLPADQQNGCDPDQPDQSDCQDPDSVGMVLAWPNSPR